MDTKTVWKFDVVITDRFTLYMPKGAKILTVQTQRDIPFLWALVDPAAEKETRHFRLAGTGHPLNDEVVKLDYIGTFQIRDDSLVFHLFEEN